jgi:hypothetical protein
MNKPSKSSHWKENGGDPCGDYDSWKGIECRASSVTEMCVIVTFPLKKQLVQTNLSSERYLVQFVSDHFA